jgi:hypothetical protein
MLKIVGTALTAAALFAGIAQADPALIRKDVAVSMSDLDLSTESGAKTLITRIEKAASEACGTTPYFYSYYSVAPGLATKQFSDCRTNAIGTAVKAVNAPLVHQIFASNTSYVRVATGR